MKSDWLDGAEDIRRYDFMAAAVRLETLRILLPGYGCQMWYLGERVCHWHLGPSRRRIPFPIVDTQFRDSWMSMRQRTPMMRKIMNRSQIFEI